MRLPRLPRENRGTWIAAIVLGLVAIVVAGLAVHELTKQKAVYNPKAPFNAGQTTTPPVKKTATKDFLWPVYGYNDARTRVFVGPSDLTPPFTEGWKLSGNAPLEFPPDIYGNTLYFMDDHASVNKVNAETGHRYWRKHVGIWSAASPALDPKLGLLYVPVLSLTEDAPGNGQFVAMSMKNGDIKWKVPIPAGTESSPLVSHGIVYFGDSGASDGMMYALSAKTGRLIWKFPTDGAVKGGPSLAGGKLFFGNYAGQLFAVNAKNGAKIWEATVSGHIYASPTLAYGRVYVGSSTTGFMYAFEQSDGALAWSIGTGNYVYSSAAADTVPVLGATIYFGSYTGNAYAVNAKSGAVDWEKNINDSISGAASIINNVVYFSGVYKGLSVGYNVTTGADVFNFNDGAYTTMVASPRALYLSGHYTLYEMLPKH
jgi:outer membrane protein assembly factor BamB